MNRQCGPLERSGLKTSLPAVEAPAHQPALGNKRRRDEEDGSAAQADEGRSTKRLAYVTGGSAAVATESDAGHVFSVQQQLQSQGSKRKLDEVLPAGPCAVPSPPASRIRPRWEAGSPAPSPHRLFSPRAGAAQLNNLPPYDFSRQRPRRSSTASDASSSRLSRLSGASDGGRGGNAPGSVRKPAAPPSGQQFRRKLVAVPSRLGGAMHWLQPQTMCCCGTCGAALAQLDTPRHPLQARRCAACGRGSCPAVR